MNKDIFLPELESVLSRNSLTLSNEAREISQKLISALRIKQDYSFEGSKVAIGEICRVLGIVSIKNEFCRQWFISFWNSPDMESTVMVSTPVITFND